MSAQTWIAEYMPEPADSPAAQEKPVSHCLRKWRGATKERLEKHGLFIMPSLGAKHCALCHRHGFKGVVEGSIYPNCDNCELAETVGVPCDHYDGEDDTEIDPYSKYFTDKDPQPMIEALEKTLAKYPHL